MTGWTDLITAEKVGELHAQGMKRHGGGRGLLSRPIPGCVEGALGNAWSAELYLEETTHRVPGLVFAGFVLFYLAKNHCFTDGNKRAAWLAAMWVLSVRGVTVTATTDEAEAMIQAAIEGTVESGVDVARWLAQRLVAPDTPS